MKSIRNKLTTMRSKADSVELYDEIIKLENDYYKLKNAHSDLEESNKKLEYEKKELISHLNSRRHKEDLTKLSKKISLKIKDDPANLIVAEIALLKATILDHFTLAYMADSGLGPSELSLTQKISHEKGTVEFNFEKNHS